MNLHEDKPLWVPSAERIAGANVTAFRRAGADLIITYHAKEAAQWLNL